MLYFKLYYIIVLYCIVLFGIVLGVLYCVQVLCCVYLILCGVALRCTKLVSQAESYFKMCCKIYLFLSEEPVYL